MRKPRRRWCRARPWSWTLSRRLVRRRRQIPAMIRGTDLVVADEGHVPASLGSGLRLAEVVEEGAEAERAAPRELVGEGLGEKRLDLARQVARECAAGRLRCRATPRARRGCGRGRRGDGSGSGRRREASPAREGLRRSAQGGPSARCRAADRARRRFRAARRTGAHRRVRRRGPSRRGPARAGPGVDRQAKARGRAGRPEAAGSGRRRTPNPTRLAAGGPRSRPCRRSDRSDRRRPAESRSR